MAQKTNLRDASKYFKQHEKETQSDTERIFRAFLERDINNQNSDSIKVPKKK